MQIVVKGGNGLVFLLKTSVWALADCNCVLFRAIETRYLPWMQMERGRNRLLPRLAKLFRETAPFLHGKGGRVGARIDEVG